jgi:hypothetical protein
MSEKWDALRIAKWFEGGYGGCEMEAAAELRRLSALNQELLEAIGDALKTAEFERHPYRPWHSKAREAIVRAAAEIERNMQ